VPLEDARPWACRPSGSSYATAAAARAACSAAPACKGYFRAPQGFETSASLPSECARAAGATDTPAEFYAKAALAPPAAAPPPTQGEWTRVASDRVGSCGAWAGVAQHNSTYRVCANSDKASARCAYLASGHLNPAMCVPDAEPTYAAFVPKFGSAFGPPRELAPPTVASCAYRAVPEEADARCLCAADPKCAGYYRGSGCALSVAAPGECEVEWQLNAATVDAARDRCTLLGAAWASTDAGYCAPTCGSTRHVMCGAKPPCPAGWAEDGGRCLPPCPWGRGRGGWCLMSGTAPNCPRGFAKHESEISPGIKYPPTCVPTVGEIESLLRGG
jgi:hypothetical protein